MKFQTNCVFCGEPYTAYRTTAKYCSDGCRVKANRQHTAGVNIQHELSILTGSLIRLNCLPDSKLFAEYSAMQDVIEALNDLKERYAKSTWIVRDLRADDLFGMLESLPEYLEVSVAGGTYREMVYCNREIKHPSMICFQFDDSNDKIVLPEDAILKVRYD